MVLHLVFNFVRNYASNHCKRTDFNVMFIILFVVNALLTKLVPPVPCWSLIFVYFCCSCWRTRKFEAKGKAVLVTGCDSGFGFILAKDLKNMGCKVFASVINDKGESAKTLKANGITVFQCDVSKDDDIQKLIQVIEKELAGNPLWECVSKKFEKKN
ncbi:unnamed protein product [Oikopleura dioica]|uniref:Uncharacterized protein n=1 Tax=Oikopleura dioica TaxID=34765 RepID=E4Z661_OIKDI|nr:unnamed protein product [Oikopleura dioica]